MNSSEKMAICLKKYLTERSAKKVGTSAVCKGTPGLYEARDTRGEGVVSVSVRQCLPTGRASDGATNSGSVE